MALVRWEPIRELDSLQGEMNRLFDTFFGNGRSPGETPMRRWMPAMDLVETEGELILKADLPGLSEEDVAIEVDGRTVAISGERKAEERKEGEGYIRVERSSGSFARTLTLPEEVDAERVAASFDKGVLEVRVPKPEQRKPQRVKIGAGAGAKTIEAESSES